MSQFLKSVFISAYPLLCLVAVVLAIMAIYNGNLIEGFALLLTSLPMPTFVGSLFVMNIARTSSSLTAFTGVVVVGLLLMTWNWFSGSISTYLSYLGFCCGLLWFAYLRWYSVFADRKNNLLEVGAMLPSFLLEDENGESISSESFMRQKSIFMFYRGNWCPLCMAQIKELVAKYKELEEQGIQTILVSPQSHKKTKTLAAKLGVEFRFMVDKNNAAARKLNLISEMGLPMGMQVLGYDSDTVMPTILLTNEKGTIIYSDLTSNYRVRPEPEAFLKAFV